MLTNNIKRQHLHIISRHSNLTKAAVQQALEANIYHDKKAWQQFLKLFFITLGIGFTLAGIIFFFAYNWANLHKFAKIGIIEGLIILATVLVLIPAFNINSRNIILTGTAVMVGVLFAVFGQVYQTGANAYDFFLAWTVFITLWVAVSNFAPLWLLYLLLINLTLMLYAQQVARSWDGLFVFTLHFIINTAAFFISLLVSRFRKTTAVPDWFLIVVALAAVTFATIGIVLGIFSNYQTAFPILVVITASVYALGIWHGLKDKNGFYLSVIPFSIIIILSALLIKISDGEMMFLLVSLFIIGSVTLVIKNLVSMQKKKTNEQ